MPIYWGWERWSNLKNKNEKVSDYSHLAQVLKVKKLNEINKTKQKSYPKQSWSSTKIERKRIQYASSAVFPRSVVMETNRYLGSPKFFRTSNPPGMRITWHFTTVASRALETPWVNSFRSLRVSWTREGGLKKCHLWKLSQRNFKCNELHLVSAQRVSSAPQALVSAFSPKPF